jgi:transposase-like protein
MSEVTSTVEECPGKRRMRMKERTKLVLEWERRWNESEGGQVNVAELCRMFGVSRPTGYRWIDRYRESARSLASVEERSRRPKSSPYALSPEVEGLIVAAQQYPKWGPRKLHARLVERNPGARVPGASVIAKAVVSKILYLRQSYHFGAGKIRDYLKRFHSIGIAAATVQRLLNQFTAIDDCTRIRVLKIYDACNQSTDIDFANEVVRRLPFRVQLVQTDNGAEFQS